MKTISNNITFKHIAVIILILKIVLGVYLGYAIYSNNQWNNFHLPVTFYYFILAGFIAQLIDGALGMAYGVTSTSFLVYIGQSQKVATSAVHVAEVFTTGVSGLSHLALKNIDKHLFVRLVLFGVLGACTGAYIISKAISEAQANGMKPYISSYLLILGILIIRKAMKNVKQLNNGVKNVGKLAFFGGLMDAIGGGGWGPIVTSNIINQGKNPRETVGTVNTAEFFITYAASGVFLFFVHPEENWQAILGLIIGGIIASPFGALLIKFIPKNAMMKLVGGVIIFTSLITIIKALS